MGGSDADVLDADLRDAVLEALQHPLKAKVLTALAERPGVTIRQMAERLKESPRRIRHQVNALVEVGLVEVSAEVRRRGVIERRYASRVAMDFPGDDIMDPALRLRYSKEVVRMLMNDVGAATAAGTFAVGPDRYECRFYGEVDDQCLEELAEIHERVYREFVETFVAGRERVRESGEPGTEVVSALLFFDAELWGRTAKEP
ncbi:MAG TPA: helix-turn-helix domain-containing protein [Solirubrobacterales bacterium]|jgi:DNA-binding transcriptional ArsR family regulator|nr:helix-turn-helix domain-containing protein [Solirubrobacterales bacterium]